LVETFNLIFFDYFERIYGIVMNTLLHTHKALIITVLISSTVVLLVFNVHLTKRNALIAETYYELLPEDEITKEREEIAELIESLDEVLTNKAFNETKKFDDFEDEEFKNTIEKLRNRDSRDTEIQESSNSENKDTNMEDDASYENINEIIANRSEKKRKSEASNSSNTSKRSSVSFSLVDRVDEYLPPPIYLCEKNGKVVITIEVDKNGNVIEANYNSASSSSDGCLVDHAIEYALASKFSADSKKSHQIGTITFYFKGKR